MTDLAPQNQLAAQVELLREQLEFLTQSQIDEHAVSVRREMRRPVEELVDAYLEFCGNKGYAKGTMHGKGKHLAAFMRNAPGTLAELRPADILAAMREQIDRGKSACTANHVRKDAIAFLSWCVTNGSFDSQSLQRMKTVEKFDESSDRRYVRRAIEPEEIPRLLAAAGKHRLWYELALYAGLRRGDLVRLRWSHIDLVGRTITITGGKAKRCDVVPVSDLLLPCLEEAHPPASELESDPGKKVFRYQVTARTQRRHLEEAGLYGPDRHGKRVDLHACRTTLATELVRAGVSAPVLKRIMRHSSIKTTDEHYLALGINDAIDAVNRFGREPRTLWQPAPEAPPGADSGRRPERGPEHRGEEGEPSESDGEGRVPGPDPNPRTRTSSPRGKTRGSNRHKPNKRASVTQPTRLTDISAP